jgi:hypothetical protein
MYLPNETDYYSAQGTIYRKDPKAKRTSEKQRIKERYEKEHEHKLTKKERRNFRNHLRISLRKDSKHYDD